MAENIDVAIDHFSPEFNPNVGEDGKLPTEKVLLGESSAPKEEERDYEEDTVGAAPDIQDVLTRQVADAVGVETSEGDEEQPEEEVKYFTIQDGDEEVQLAETTEIPVKVGKKEQMVSLAKLRDTYSGATGIKKQSEYLQTQKEEIEAAKAEHQKNLAALNTKLSKFANAIDRGDHEVVINEMLAAVGKDSEQFWGQWHNKMSEFYGQYNNLSPQQRQAVVEDRKQKQLLQKYKEQEHELTQLQQNQQYTQFASDLLNRNGLQQADVKEVWAYLDGQAKQGALSEDDVKYLQTAPNEKKLEYAVNYALGFKNYNRVAGVLTKVEGIAEKDLPDVISDLYSTLGDQIYSITDKDLTDVIQGAYVNKEQGSRSSGALKSKASPRLKKSGKGTSVQHDKMNPWARTAQDFMS